MRTDTWTIEGGTPLRGEVRVSGAKNSITKLMVTSMLTKEPCVLHNTPHIGDSQITRAICEALGAEFKEHPPRTLYVHTPRLVRSEVPLALGNHNRLAIMMVAPLLHRTGQAIIPIAAGGDRIGQRPVNFHLEGYRRLGAHVEEADPGFMDPHDEISAMWFAGAATAAMSLPASRVNCAARGGQLVLHHGRGCAAHRHGAVARALVCFAQPFGFGDRMEAHCRKLEIFAPKQICGGNEKDDCAQTCQKQERKRDQINKD
jgi:hypothetical protein